jgi:hypothetical protein
MQPLELQSLEPVQRHVRVLSPQNDVAPLGFLKIFAEPKSSEVETSELSPHHFIALASPP